MTAIKFKDYGNPDIELSIDQRGKWLEITITHKATGLTVKLDKKEASNLANSLGGYYGAGKTKTEKVVSSPPAIPQTSPTGKLHEGDKSVPAKT